MAINFGGYASAYGGGGGAGNVGTPESAAGSVIGGGLGAAIGAIPTFNERFNKLFNQNLVYGEGSALGTIREAYTGDIKDFDLTAKPNDDGELINPLPSLETAYTNFYDSLDPRVAKRAERRGLLNKVK